jgi:hypothetical protein
MADFRYPYDIASTLDPWRSELGGDFESVVARLADRDRALEDYITTRLPHGWLGYAEVTANQGSITTVVDLTDLSVTVTIAPGRRIRISAFTAFASTVADDTAELLIKEGATQLNRADVIQRPADVPSTAIAFYVGNPTAGSHTYKLAALRGAGTGTLTMAASATNPAFLLVEDIGPRTLS